VSLLGVQRRDDELIVRRFLGKTAIPVDRVKAIRLEEDSVLWYPVRLLVIFPREGPALRVRSVTWYQWGELFKASQPTKDQSRIDKVEGRLRLNGRNVA
jgi:hypothetical protein